MRMSGLSLDIQCIAWLARISSDNRVVHTAYYLICDRGILSQVASKGWYECLAKAQVTHCLAPAEDTHA